MCSFSGGTIYGDHLAIYTYDGHGSAIATDQGGGLIVVKDSTANTYGTLSALVYSTGNIPVSSLSDTAAIAHVYPTDIDATGDVDVDEISAITLYLIGSSGTGALNAGNTPWSAAVYVDSSSTGALTGESHVDSIGQEDGSSIIPGQHGVGVA